MAMCTHCSGTLLCQFSVIRAHGQGPPHLHCETCGSGPPGAFGFLRPPHMKPPSCKVCAGTERPR